MSPAAKKAIERLYPDPEETTVARELERYVPTERASENRPFVAVNFASTLDGRAAVQGRSAAIGSQVDAALLLGLRTRFDAVMVGAGTLRTERYGRLVSNADERARRERRGLAHDPLAVIITATLDLPWDAGLFTSGAGRVLIFTTSEADPPETATSVRVERHEGRKVDMKKAIEHLYAERGIRALLCEGGPDIHGQLEAAGVVDDLFLTFGPRLSGGNEPRILEGKLPDIREAALVSLLRDGSELMARYAIAG